MLSKLKKIPSRKILKYILISSFVLSIAYSFYFRINPVVDANAYDRIAVNIVEGFGFIEDRTVSFEYDKSIVRAGPGYEYFLAGVYFIFGHNYEIVWFLQAVLHVLSAYIIFLIAKQLFKDGGEKIGIVSAAIFAFSPDLVEISAMLMTETLYLFFTILIFYLFVRIYQDAGSKPLTVVTGISMGAAILMRPPLLLFIPVFLVLYLYRKQYSLSMLFLGSTGLIILPWVIRNYTIYDQFILTTMIAEYNLWVGNTLLSEGGQIAGGFNVLEDYVSKNGFFGLKQKAQMEFFTFIFTHPFVFIKLTFIRFIRYFSLIRPMGFWFYQVGIGQMIMVTSSLLWIAFLFVTGFSGMVSLLLKKNKIFCYLTVLALTSPLVLLPTVVQSRYRFQIYPFLCIFAGYFLVAFIKEKKWWKKKEFFIPTLFLVVVSLIDVFFSLDKVLERIGGLF